ncbi:MAG: mitochondrial import receptor protein [Bathelium mastoideum]|nr:MAG: mitochondrial import receptor protein [Bathelium mastoideum]KAI9687907.1 MAG: mitochondrial import receptor protein [Bathelium mastoideum]
MVKLEEVKDEDLDRPQEGPLEDDGDWDTDEESVISEDDAGLFDESLLERVYALKDAIPPSTRRNVAFTFNTAYTYGKKAITLGGKTLWVISSSALLLGVPWALAFSEEQQLQEMEREVNMQKSANDLLTQGANVGAGQALGTQQAKPSV